VQLYEILAEFGHCLKGLAGLTGLLREKYFHFFVMPQLRVGHWVYRIEDQYPENPLFLRQNGGSLSAAQLAAKMVRCGKFFEKYHGLVSQYGVFPDFPNLTTLFGVTRPLRLKYKLPNFR
jgi:hypothetical protein